MFIKYVLRHHHNKQRELPHSTKHNCQFVTHCAAQNQPRCFPCCGQLCASSEMKDDRCNPSARRRRTKRYVRSRCNALGKHRLHHRLRKVPSPLHHTTKCPSEMPQSVP